MAPPTVINLTLNVTSRTGSEDAIEDARRTADANPGTIVTLNIVSPLWRKKEVVNNAVAPADNTVPPAVNTVAPAGRATEWVKIYDPSDEHPINTVPKKELENIAGIGPAYAKLLMDHRPLRSWKQVRDIKGIGQKKYDSIRGFFEDHYEEDLPDYH